MSWTEDLVIMLRTEVGDLDATAYSDSRLRQVLVYAAYSVYQSARFLNTYTINISELTISPDPITSNDYDFSVLTVYKAACIIMTGEAKDVGGKSVSIKDGPSSFDNRTSGSNMLSLMKTMCATYGDLLLAYQLAGSAQDGLSTGNGQAILSPYSPGSFLKNWTYGAPRSGSTAW
jgi:hypothetical protein